MIAAITIKCPQRLRMSGQHRAAQVLKAPVAALAAIVLTVGLVIAAPVVCDTHIGAPWAANAVLPAALPHESLTFDVTDQ